MKKKPIDQDAYDFYCCLKKEPLNECEKGNKGYVWDIKLGLKGCNKYGCMTGDSEKWDFTKATIQGKPLTNFINYTKSKTCRKKTIKDFDCKDLKKFLIICENNSYIHIRNGELECVTSLSTCCSKEQVYDIAIEKGCVI